MSSEIEKYLYYPEIAPRRVMRIDFIKIFALALILIGLIGVYIASTALPAPIYRIRDIVGNFYLNYATVMIEGRIVQPVRLDLQTGGRIRLTIYIADEEGFEPFIIYVYDPVASKLLSSDKYVDFGDIVRIVIQIRVREDFTYGILQDILHIINITRSWSEPINVYNLAGIDEYKFVCTSGSISSVRNVSTGLLIYMNTLNGTVTVLIPRTFNYRFSNMEDYRVKWSELNKIGTVLKVCGPVYYYRVDQPEIVVVRYEDIIIETTPTYPEAPEVSIDKLSNYIGQYVTVSGLFNKLSYDRDQRLYVVAIIDDKGNKAFGQASREIINASINPWIVGIGSKLKLTGLVINNNTISVSHIGILEIQPPLNTTRVREALDQSIGTIVVLWNVKVASVRVTSTGNWIIDVTDNIDTITIFIPSSVARGISQQPPPEGTYISIAGYRDIYGTTEEIVVYTENGLKIMVQQPVVPAPIVYQSISLSEISNYINRNVSVTAELVGIRYSAGRYYVAIRENNIVVNASMTRSLVININPWRAGPGTIVRVNGTVRSSNLIETHYISIVEARDTPIYTSISDVLKQSLGSIVAVVNATVVNVRVTSGNDWQITIRDESGSTILVFIPRSVVSDIGLNPPNEGSIISIAGYRDVYGGTQEIVVYSRDGYRV